MGFTPSIYYDNDNIAIVVKFPNTLGQGRTEITNGTIEDEATSNNYYVVFIKDIIGNIVLNVTFANPYV